MELRVVDMEKVGGKLVDKEIVGSKLGEKEKRREERGG